MCAGARGGDEGQSLRPHHPHTLPARTRPDQPRASHQLPLARVRRSVQPPSRVYCSPSGPGRLWPAGW
eukprot:2343123-Pleurochrysis_carterae.AAC.2